jgi:hypothetical protein
MPDYTGNFTGEYPILNTARGLRYDVLSAYQKRNQTKRLVGTGRRATSHNGTLTLCSSRDDQDIPPFNEHYDRPPFS